MKQIAIKQRQPKANSLKFLFLVSLPETKEFIKEMPFVEDTTIKLKSLGVDVYNRIDSDVLSLMVNYNYVIVVAHHDEMTDSLIFRDRKLAMSDFVTYIPEDFSGVIDFSSCYSAGVMSSIKARTNYKCKVQTVIKQTTLALRLIMYPHIVQLLTNDSSLEYNEAYDQVLDAITLGISHADNSDTNHSTILLENKEYAGKATKLGDNLSTIYAPSKVKRNQTFLINIFFHKDEESGVIELLSQRLDPKTSLVDTQIIPIPLNVKDKLTARLDINFGNTNGINVNNGIDTKSIIWFNRATKIQFPVTIKEDFIGDTITCEIKLEVNSEPIGECVFVITVSETVSEIPCLVSLSPHNKGQEQNNAKMRLQSQFMENMTRLEKEINNASSEEERKTLQVHYDVCKKCINLVNEVDVKDVKDSIKKVFISSTSDMAQYRDIVKDEILSCGMYPVDYRTWYQSEQQPCDVCCKRVMESDVILCIIGARYGYVEPSIGISMTQMEYETALMAGIKILAYIIDPLDESNENEHLQNKQQDFIKEIKTSRILKFFSDDYSLGKDTTRELSYLK